MKKRFDFNSACVAVVTVIDGLVKQGLKGYRYDSLDTLFDEIEKIKGVYENDKI